MTTDILLFDLDGVLVEPIGYRRALQETIARVGRALGYKAVQLSAEDIAAFEAAEATSEWDSAAMCCALLLQHAWQHDPGLPWPREPTAPEIGLHGLPAPDFGAFARRLATIGPDGDHVPVRAEAHLLDDGNLTSQQAETLRSILRNARDVRRSATHRIFQELALGSAAFEAAYNIEPALTTESYLQKYDQTTLTRETMAGLHAWLTRAAHAAAIFTNRPSHSPGALSGTPEAEAGAHVAGLSALPIVGLGALNWLSNHRAVAPDTFTKPSPTHALAALRAAAGDTLTDSLLAAASLALDATLDDGWARFSDVNIHVYEDSAKGMRSAIAAADLLQAFGIHLDVRLYGISSDQLKRQALRAAGGSVYSSLDTALANTFSAVERLPANQI